MQPKGEHSFSDLDDDIKISKFNLDEVAEDLDCIDLTD